MAFYINSYEQYTEDYTRALLNPEEFWADIANNFEWSQSWDKVLEYDFSEGRNQWFINAKLNITINCLDRHAAATPDKLAICWEANSPETPNRQYTYKELLDRVCQVANGLKSKGIVKGDRVCIYMPMIPELLISVLACARIGAVHSVVFGGFSPKALAERMQQAEAKMLITSDVAYRGEKVIDILTAARVAYQISPTAKQMLIFDRSGEGKTYPEQSFSDFDSVANAQSTHCPAEIMDAEDMLFILYTSGSTGTPKGIVHTCGGYMVYTGYTFANVFQYKEKDVFFCTADIGWITGHSYMAYGALLNGATQLMYEGVPTYPDASRFWQLIEKHKVTHFYTAPTAIRALMALGDEYVQGWDLSTLKVLGSVGEPINEEAWHWYNEQVGKERCPIVDTWWQTETGGIMISTIAGISQSIPSWAGYPLVGVQMAIMDENGEEIHSNEADGALCLKTPIPSLLRTTYGDHNRCKNTYFSAYPNHYFTGDRAKRDAEGRYRIIGRMDDVLNVSGHRIGTAEVENVLNQHIEIVESAAVGYAHPIKGEAIAAFVIPFAPVEDKNKLFAELQFMISKEIGSFSKIETLVVVTGLPKTRSGKIMRRILKKILANEPDYGDISTLLNPEVVEEIAQQVSSLK